MHDIEPNPGPNQTLKIRKSTLTVITLNCRGLGVTEKFRLMLNKAYDLMSKGETIIMLQETMVTSNNYLQLAWRGKHVFTPGTGNSQGCITLVNSDANIEHIYQIGNRGHYFTYSSDNVETLVVMNIYAPSGFNDAKMQFFEDIFSTISTYDCDVLVAGDMNVTLRPSDRHCRGVTNAEELSAELVKDYIETLNLNDVWDGKNGYTWQQGKKMSKVDRILYRLTNFARKKIYTDWTFIRTDHAAVVAQFEHEHKVTTKSSHVKLCNEILKDPVKLNELRHYLITQLSDPQLGSFNPHAKLEFAKMTIRSKALDIMAQSRKKQNMTLVELNKDINKNTSLLSNEVNAELQNILVSELELLKTQRDSILDIQGYKLAKCAKTKWYNEGEKSNKYFLNLLKRQQYKSEMDCLIINGIEVKDHKRIREYVQNFYKNLYNHGRQTEIDHTFFDNMFVVDADQNNSIHKELTLQELWQTLKPLKATTPGPDGISNTYLKKLFDILGPMIIDAWKYSLDKQVLMPSHRKSLLRLIPKPGKDKRELKNWRPITLSNCDHKLITKTYNSRLLATISNYISSTQTAYIKGRNIADNLRLLNALTKNCSKSLNMDYSVIALDAQKAFDSVTHEYLIKVLERIGLSNFIPIFKLLYKELQNDILINGQTGTSFEIKNGVKQGDALSCSLFILAVEPIIRNLQHNEHIQAASCNRIRFTWPKVLAYADDISVITKNSHRSIQAIFTEYERLSKASGLYLNADKTELFNIASPDIFAMQQHHVRYAGKNYDIINSESVKINGIVFNNNAEIMAEENFIIMYTKMTRHFSDWSKRHLSILGKIQIIKTFGLSQYLYSLAVIDLLPTHWKDIKKAIAKFIWNKNYAGNRAPNRFKDEILYKSVDKGGFGMIQLEKIVAGLRIRRVCTLLEKDDHPIGLLQAKLGMNDFLRKEPVVDIDAPTKMAMALIAKHNLSCLTNYDIDELEFDRLLRLKLGNIKISHIVGKQRRNNAQLARLRHIGAHTVHDALTLGAQVIEMLARLCEPELRDILRALTDIVNIEHRAQTPLNLHIYNEQYRKWENIATLRSREIRNLLYGDTIMLRTKKLEFTRVEQAQRTYNKIKAIQSVPLKTKVLRLIHGDVYCGTRLVKFKLSDIDTCIRCFETETIEHLVEDCPYSRHIWASYGIANPTIRAILDPDITNPEFEIRASLIETIIFRKQIIPPDIVIMNTFTKYAQGLGCNKKLADFAKRKLAIKTATGRWY